MHERAREEASDGGAGAVVEERRSSAWPRSNVRAKRSSGRVWNGKEGTPRRKPSKGNFWPPAKASERLRQHWYRTFNPPMGPRPVHGGRPIPGVTIGCI